MTAVSDLDTPAVTVDMAIMEDNIRRVQAHLARVRDKTGVRRRSQLARWATEHAVL